ncbi:MAG: antitoxin YezG family protein [Lachnospiraceae bacterium]|jgi:uncharacterized protein (TIGR01741 family)|nr:antitoxin YezG family protein [Lachnospiraceae bacterium]
MEGQLNQLYNKIANQVISMIPTDWEKIYFLGEVEKEQSSVSSIFYFLDSATNQMVRCHSIPDIYNVSEEIFDDMASELIYMVLELNNCFKENEQELWEQVVLMVEKDGTFSVDFNYDVMDKDDDGGQLYREVIWAYKTCGYVPAEGSYHKEVLDKYLGSIE